MFPCDVCGWMPEDCPCAANETTMAQVRQRHQLAVKRANTARHARKRLRTLALEGEWLTSQAWTVAHQFRPDEVSHCGVVRVNDHLQRAGTTRRCQKCSGAWPVRGSVAA